MSRIGRKPIPLPSGVQVTLKGTEVTVKGPKGSLTRTFHPDMRFEIDQGNLTVLRPSDSRVHRSLHGLTRTLVANMVQGVSQGFQKSLEIVGVGYRAQVSAQKVTFQVGYSHPVEVTAPSGIAFQGEGANKVIVSGIDKELVGEVAAKLRAVRPPDHYKGKGVRYSGEYVRLKPGKAGKAAGGKK